MRAALLTGTSGPDVLEVRADVPEPSPGPHDVLIRVSACGVNNTDLETRRGWNGESGRDGGFALPLIPGADICGHVACVGSEVYPGLVGRRVLVDPWIRRSTEADWRDHTAYLGSEIDGGFAELCVVPADNVFTVESTLSDVELATFACSWSAAGNMLARADLAAGQRIAITGASGGVGGALVQLAKLRGAVVTAIAAAARVPAVVAMGADLVVARETNDVPQLAARDGGPFDVVADVVGGADVAGWLRSMRRGGRYVCSGPIAGPVVDLDLRVMYLNDLQLIGATACPPRVFAELVELIESDSARPLVGATYPLERIHEAQEAFDANQHVGSIVVTLQ